VVANHRVLSMDGPRENNPAFDHSKWAAVRIYLRGFVLPIQAPVSIAGVVPLWTGRSGGFSFRRGQMPKDDVVRIPPEWMAEVREAYRQYCDEWQREETERTLGTGDTPEPPQPWVDFFREYLFAELQNCVYVGVTDITTPAAKS